jgi:hypothetical protein
MRDGKGQAGPMRDHSRADYNGNGRTDYNGRTGEKGGPGAGYDGLNGSVGGKRGAGKGDGKGGMGSKGGKLGRAGRQTLRDLFAEKHHRMEQYFDSELRKRGAVCLSRDDLRSASESNLQIYDLFLDVMNYVLLGNPTMSDTDQWTKFSRELKTYYDIPDVLQTQGSPPQYGNPAPANRDQYGNNHDSGAKKEQRGGRPGLTMGDFVITNASDAKKKKKKEKEAEKSKKEVENKEGTPDKDGDNMRGPMEDSATKEKVGSATKNLRPKTRPAANAKTDCKTEVCSEWICPRCTLQNSLFDTICKACGFSKDQARLLDEFPPLAALAGKKK